jgi:hypothetical protein
VILPEPDPLPAAATQRAGVTVDAPGSALVLPQCVRLDERLTVTVSAVAERGPTIVRLVPGASLTGFISAVSPVEGYAIQGAQELTFDVAWLGAVPGDEDEQVFHGTLEVLVNGLVAAVRRVRVTVPAGQLHQAGNARCWPWSRAPRPAHATFLSASRMDSGDSLAA